MDISDPDIYFDEQGICNHCRGYEARLRDNIPDEEDRSLELSNAIKTIKKAGIGKKYDCIIGISGGVDSSYVAYIAKNYNLRALLVHLDNGWNSELAVKNIENIVAYTGYDLFTIVINWDEFKDLQRSFFSANVVDIELLSDHAIMATMYKLSRKYNIKYSLSGENFVTEAIMPISWNWRKSDKRNIKSIHKKFGQKKLKTFPFLSTFTKMLYQYLGICKSIPILDYLAYSKSEAMQEIQKNMNWKYYGGKHYESIFTRLYQGVILPKKFKIDKRRAHLSTLINSGQISRESALNEIKEPTYDESLQKNDVELLCKKLDFTLDYFDSYLSEATVKHSFYDTDEHYIKLLKKLALLLGLDKSKLTKV